MHFNHIFSMTWLTLGLTQAFQSLYKSLLSHHSFTSAVFSVEEMEEVQGSSTWEIAWRTQWTGRQLPFCLPGIVVKYSYLYNNIYIHLTFTIFLHPLPQNLWHLLHNNHKHIQYIRSWDIDLYLPISILAGHWAYHEVIKVEHTWKCFCSFNYYNSYYDWMKGQYIYTVYRGTREKNERKISINRHFLRSYCHTCKVTGVTWFTAYNVILVMCSQVTTDMEEWDKENPAANWDTNEESVLYKWCQGPERRGHWVRN